MRVVILLLLLSICLCEFPKEGKNVLLFDDSNIEEAMAEFENLFILFYY